MKTPSSPHALTPSRPFSKQGYLSEIFVSFQGEGAHVGRRHLFVRLAGCNLRCSYCDTPDSLERVSRYTVHESMHAGDYANPISPQALTGLIHSILEQHAPIDAVALTGGEPLMQSEFLGAMLQGARFPVPVLLETNGVLPRRLREVLALVDIISMDIKLPSNTGEGSFWDEHTQFINLARTRDLYVKVLVDQSTAPQEVRRAAAILAPIRPEVPVFLQPITDAAHRSTIDAERLAELYAAAREYLTAVRVLPQTHKLLGIR